MATTVLAPLPQRVDSDGRWATLVRTVKVLGLRPAWRANKVRRFSNDLLRGFYSTRAVIALHNVGFFDEIARRGTVNLDVFAADQGLDLTVLRALCDYLQAVRILKRKGAGYSLESSESVITTLRGPFYSVYAYQDIFRNLEEILRQEKTFGVEVVRDPGLVARGSGAVGQLFVFPMMADTIVRHGYGNVLDLCCGDATFLIDLCGRVPGLRARGIDISTEAIAAGRQHVECRGLSHRIDLVAADVFCIDRVAAQFKGIDAVTCIYALHEFLTDDADQERILDLFTRFKATFPGVPLVICEVIRHTPAELRERPGGVAEIQLWHDLSNQRLLSRQQWKELFERAGFTRIDEDYLGIARTAIFTVS